MRKRISVWTSTLLAALFALTACAPKPTEEPTTDPTPSEGEYTLPLEDGMNQLTIYYNNPDGYDNADVWVWWDGSPDGMGGQLFHPCEYGAKMVINVPATIAEVGFIIRLNCVPGSTNWDGVTKDATDADRHVGMTQRETVIYTKAGDANNYISDDGGKTLNRMKYVSMADMQTKSSIRVILSDVMTPTAADVTLTDSIGLKTKIASIETSGGDSFVIVTEKPLDLGNEYSLKVNGFGDAVTVVPFTYFSSEEFGNEFNYDGPLGVELQANRTIFRLWAPTCSNVKLNLYPDGADSGAEQTVSMTRGEKGVWTYTAEENLSGKYYTYTVYNSSGMREAVDPYAVSAGVNGNRGMVLDLDSTDPAGWTNENFVPSSATGGKFNYTDAEIWEVHVRDFSNRISGSQYKGKYLAFTETGLTENGIPVGVDYLKQLGITHVHLLPSFDYATVDETECKDFNWGYDPKNYNVPEGSYSTNPADGAVRVKEYKQMVQALHNAGIGVIMDVVYNHTSGLDSNFNKIVPYYYYRFNGNGTASNGSGCGNETASERYMFRKYMVDSVKYWQSEYNLDGFRFDLMGLHDMETMQEISDAVYLKNQNALIYGEGWTGGTSTLAQSRQSILKNLKELNKNSQVNGVAMFNDVLRDAIKGSVFDINDTGFATGAKEDRIAKVLFGVNGSVFNSDFGTSSEDWSAYNPTNVINYVSAHDNNTLWDRICAVYGEGADTLELRLKRNRLSAAIVQTSLGIPFMQAGEEMLRQKKNADGSYNENSYNASDEVNNLRWELLSEGSEQYNMMLYYRGLIAFRMAHPVLRSTSAKGICTLVSTDGALIAFTMKKGEEELFIVYNANESARTVALPAGSWTPYIDGVRAGIEPLGPAVSGTQEIDSVSCFVFVKN